MIQIISGRKGKGKTKYLLDMANKAITEAHGTIVYLDKNSKHMFELNNRIRLIDVFSYPVHSYESFLGFISGIISTDHDLEQMYLDSFLKLSHLDASEIEGAIEDLKKISDKNSVNFILSVSEDDEYLPQNARECTIIAL